MANHTEGFHCTFVKQPPEVVQSECFLCQKIIREPHQVTCCGSVFCHVCIEPLKRRNKPCPKCKVKPFKSFEDKRLANTLHRFEVQCSNKTQGCQWTGILENYNDHLNCNPSKEDQLHGCEFVKIKCLHCPQLIQRCSIQNHQSDQCPGRPFSCEYCMNYTSTYEDVTVNHWLQCRDYPQECPNKCGNKFPRHSIVSHMSKSCPFTKIDCEYKEVGCNARPLRKDQDAHLRDGKDSHLSLVLTQNKQLKIQLAEKTKQIEALTTKKKQVMQELNVLRSNTSICPVEVMITNCKHHKREKDYWCSPSFYTHSIGYKMFLRVTINGVGEGEGTHISLHVYIMKGAYDNQLKWPFRGKVTIQLLNQENNKTHHEETLEFDNDTPDEIANRVTEGEQSKKGWGFPTFIAHSDLHSGFLKNNSLKLRITYVHVDVTE